MSYNFGYTHVIILFIAGLAAFILAGFLFKNKHIPAAVYLGLVFVGIGVWIVAGGFEAAAITPEAKTLWVKVEYISLAFVMPFFIVFMVGSFRKFQELLSNLKQKEKEAQEMNQQLLEQLSETERLKKILEEQAARDPLTGLYNRRYLEVTLEREISRAIRNIHFVAFLMLDIDYFKKVNDLYGHDIGDQVLCVMAEVLTHHSRKEDVACRFGGAEFFLLLPNISIQAARDRAEEIRLSFIQRCHDLSHSMEVTVSIGVSIYPQHADTALSLVRKADQALYAAKQAGRNQVCLATENGMDD